MNKTDFYILHLLRTKPRLGQKANQVQAASDAQSNQTAIITGLTGTSGTSGAGPEAILYAQKQDPERERLLDTKKGLQQAKFQELTGIPDVLARYTDLSESQEGLAGSILTLEERNADLNESFGISTLDAQIFADRLTTLGDKIGVNQDSLKQYAKDLDGLTGGYINITNSVHEATIQQKNYTDGLLAGQRYLQQNLNLNKETAIKFEQYAATLKTSTIDLVKGMFDGENSFISQLANKTGLTDLQLARDIISDIANLSSTVKFEFGKSTSHLETAVLKARMLGTTMDKISAIGTHVLDVEKSVGGEINYQLLTGKRLLVDGDKSFTQEMRLAKIRKDGPRQAEIMYQVLKDNREELQNVPGALEAFSGTTGQSVDDITAMLNKIDIAEQLGIEEFLSGSQEEINKQLDKIKTQAAADLKSGAVDQDAYNRRMEQINDFLAEPSKTTETTHEKLVQQNLKDITTYLKDFVADYTRKNGRVTGVKRKSEDFNLQEMGKELIGILRAERKTTTDPKTFQDMKLDFKGAEAKFGQVYLYKNITGFKSGLFKQIHEHYAKLTDDESTVNEQISEGSKTGINQQKVRGKKIADERTAKTHKKSKTTTPSNVTNTNEYAAGGILNGPSHSQGGIQTAFGELEGGEAIINKKSTEKYAPLLSSINAAEGGETFSPKFKRGGIADKLVKGNSVYHTENNYNTENTYNTSTKTINSITKTIVDIFKPQQQTLETINNFLSKNTQINNLTEQLSNVIKTIKPGTINEPKTITSTTNKEDAREIVGNLTSNIIDAENNAVSNITNTNTDAIQIQQKQFELSKEAMSYSPNTFKNDLNTDKLTAIFDKLATTLTSVSTSPLDTKTLAQNFAEAMKNVNIQTTAVVKTNNSFGESTMNNAARYTS